eukprot:s3836_g10.t1
MPQAFETAVYGQPRQSKETYAEYVHRMQRNFGLLAKEGVDLPSGAKGYIIFRQSSLTEAHDQRVQTWCEGSYDEKAIIRSLRKLDKVIKEKGGKSHYVTEADDPSAVDEGTIGDYVNGTDQSDEEYIYVADGDLDVIYVVEALASYQQVRQQLKEQRLGRGFYPGKGQRPGAKGKGFGKDGGKTKVHREHLKLRTRCWRCHQVGHISSECTNKPVGGESSNSSKTSSQSGSAVSSKSGFFVTTAEEGAVANSSVSQTKESSSFWLHSFVEQQRAKTRFEASEIKEDYRVRPGFHNPTFCGIVTQGFEGVVDTAAEGSLIGTRALFDLECHLKEHGLRCQWTPKQSAAKGVGGSAVVKGVILIPLGIGGISGVLETTVVEGDVPLLLPIRLLKALEAAINIPKRTLKLESHGIEVCMRELHSGHMVRVPLPRSSSPLTVEIAMEQIFGRLRKMSQAPAVVAPSQAVARAAKKGHNTARSIRNWRGVMDKICTILTMVILQDAIGDWCPESSVPASLPSSQPTAEEIYAELIADAKPLPPLKSKEAPSVSASSCIHPTKQLKGGGNASGSWIVCRACHSRWESPFRATEVHEEVKVKKGSLKKRVDQEPDLMETEMATESLNLKNMEKTAEGMGGLENIEHYINMKLELLAQEMSHSHAAASSQDGQMQQGQRTEATCSAPEREGSPARCDDENVDGEGNNDSRSGCSNSGPDGRSQLNVRLDSSRQFGAAPQERCQTTDVLVQATCGAVHGEERGSSEGSHLLEMCPTSVRVLPLGSAGASGDAQVHAAEPQKESKDIQEQFLAGGSDVRGGGVVKHGAWIPCATRQS